MKSSDVIMTPIHKEGHIFIAAFFLASAGLFFVWEPLAWVGLILSAFCLYFFRDPDRIIPDEAGVLVSPADGTVCSISEVEPPAELGMGSAPRTRITIFLSVFNVHVNRVPAAGEVTATAYVPGKFLDAAADTASEENERQLVRMTTVDGKDIAFAQVAGLIARRILCDLKEGDKVERGYRFGLIRFGSRTDIYLDEGQHCTVKIGQTMLGGETIIARNS
ncbi:MAG: phosphatidylserine decarboxylase [Kordiimonadaceae bacterium]|nr:phosphatidylserine decarboxylase [Kordiimonadaceae bacterium]